MMRKPTVVQQTVSVVTLLAFVNCLVGCSSFFSVTSVVDVPRSELAKTYQANASKRQFVMGRAKPASRGQVKTGHFEGGSIRHIPLPGGNRWRINSKWLLSMRLSVY